MQSLGDFPSLVFIILFIIISSFRRNRFSYFGSHYTGGFSGGGFSGGGFLVKAGEVAVVDFLVVAPVVDGKKNKYEKEVN